MLEDKYKKIAQQLRKPSGIESEDIAHFMNQGNELLNRNTIAQLNLKPNSRVLEVGMGNGKFVSELLQKSTIDYYVGCDYSSEIVQQARAINQQFVNQKKVSFYCCSAHELPLADHSVDAIFTVNTIYFWDNPEEVLSEFKRVLKPNGRLVIGLRPENLMKHYPFIKFGFTLYNSITVENLLRTYGFANINHSEIEEPDFVTEEVTFPVKSLVVWCTNTNR